MLTFAAAIKKTKMMYSNSGFERLFLRYKSEAFTSKGFLALLFEKQEIL